MRATSSRSLLQLIAFLPQMLPSNYLLWFIAFQDSMWRTIPFFRMKGSFFWIILAAKKCPDWISGKEPLALMLAKSYDSRHQPTNSKYDFWRWHDLNQNINAMLRTLNSITASLRFSASNSIFEKLKENMRALKVTLAKKWCSSFFYQRTLDWCGISSHWTWLIDLSCYQLL